MQEPSRPECRRRSAWRKAIRRGVPSLAPIRLRAREPGGPIDTRGRPRAAGRSAKAMSRKADMHVDGESDGRILYVLIGSTCETVVSSVDGLTRSPIWALAMAATPSMSDVTFVKLRFNAAVSTTAVADCTVAFVARLPWISLSNWL